MHTRSAFLQLPSIDARACIYKYGRPGMVAGVAIGRRRGRSSGKVLARFFRFIPPFHRHSAAILPLTLIAAMAADERTESAALRARFLLLPAPCAGLHPVHHVAEVTG